MKYIIRYEVSNDGEPTSVYVVSGSKYTTYKDEAHKFDSLEDAQNQDYFLNSHDYDNPCFDEVED